MLDSFEKESRLQERRAARQRQMQIMEEAASGVSLPYDDAGYTDEPMGGAVGSGLEMEEGYKDEPTVGVNGSGLAIGGYVDDDSEDDVPSMYSDYPGGKSNKNADKGLKAASNLWGSGTKNDLTEDKFKFVMGEDDNSSQYSGASWRRKEHVESQELLMMAGRRVSGLEIGYGESGERRKYNRCGGWFVRYKKLLYSVGALLVVVLIVMGVSIGERSKNANHDGAEWPPKQQGSSSNGAPNYNPEEAQSNPASPQEIALNPNKELDQTKFNRIKDRILEHQISHASTLEDVDSPQFKALTWIVRDDPRQLDVASIEDEVSGVTGEELDREEALFERYALVVFWFATTDLNVVNGIHGNGRYMQNGASGTEYTQSDIQWKQSTDWLSSSGFCQWHGIVCHPDVTSSNPSSHYNDDFHVAILNLTDNNIHGQIPREVFVGLSKMQALDLSGNGLHGEIGREVGELRDLQGELLDVTLAAPYITKTS